MKKSGKNTKLVTREDLKAELRALENRMDEKFATKGDLQSEITAFETRIRDDMSYKLTSLETRLREDLTSKNDLETAVAQIIEAIDQNVAPKKDVEQLKKRVTRIEEHLDLAQ